MKLHLRKSVRGFTLIELLVVIAIIGILATLLLLQLNIARQKARDVQRVTAVNQIRDAVELYYDDNNAYPADITTATLGKYMKNGNAPSDPLGGAYGYGADPAGTRTKYQVYAQLETKANALNSDDDIDASSFAAPVGVNGAGPVGTGNEACTTRATCIFDLGSK